ncbi:hypothetical protein M1B74_01310 [Bacteroides pyogenes]|uniref:hypothetical protein n=1 Tax=Bacteroides pyogenes TaxID=310300 RepID=UPI003B438C11
MIDEIIIRKLVDYLLLNAYSVNSSGLYNGKAGISLALFETARFLQDEYIEEQAFDLLQESLITKNNDIGFENGLSGIGYVLLYLINNNFIDADFDELFGENHGKIEEKLILLREKGIKDNMFYYLTIVYYICFLQKTNSKKSMKWFIDYASCETSKLLIDRFLSIEKKNKRYSKIAILNMYQLYLKVGYYCTMFNPTTEVSGKYSELYLQDKFANNLFIGFYLRNLAKRIKDKQLWFIGTKNRETAILGFYSPILTLSEKIDLLYLFHEDEIMNNINEIKQLDFNFLEGSSEKSFEKEMIKSICPTDLIAGYKSGIARLLLYYIYQNTGRGNRFQFL